MKGTRTQPPNMKGKKMHLFGCRCCVARDLRGEYLARQHQREIWNALINSSEHEYDIEPDERS